jgi:translation elongation factor EF-1alpha
VLLVVSAVASEQQLAEVARSAAEEHLVTAFCFGIKQVVVLVNKMDLVAFSEQAYLDTKARAFKHIKKAGFKVTDETMCIPLSALTGDGFLSVSPRMQAWYDGPCFLQALDYVPLPPRHANKHFRMVVDQVFKVAGVGNVVCGKVERGILNVHDKINIYPSCAENVTVKSIESHGNAVSFAKPGDDVGIAVSLSTTDKKGKITVQQQKCRRGMIVGLSTEVAVPVMSRFEVQLFIVGKNITMKAGGAPTLLTHLCSMQVKILRIIEVLGKNNTVLSRCPSEVKTGDTCVMELQARAPLCAETIHDCPKLSRFVIQSNRMTVAIGFIRAKLL